MTTRRGHHEDGHELRGDDGAGRGALWSGLITFGLVTVPVELYSASRSTRRGLHLLDQEGHPLGYQYCCPKHGAVANDEIVRGFEVDERRYVVVTDEELEALEPNKTREIDLRRFVAREEISPFLIVTPYWLAPAEGTTKAYRLLADAMERRDRAGIATFVMRGTEYLFALVADKGILRGDILRFQEELRSPRDVGLPAVVKQPKKRVDEIARALDRLRRDALDPAELADEHGRALEDLAKRKYARGKDVVEVEAKAEVAPGADVTDLVKILKQRLAEGTPTRARPRRWTASRS
jgi:DNA end-binding protein Ku